MYVEKENEERFGRAPNYANWKKRKRKEKKREREGISESTKQGTHVSRVIIRYKYKYKLSLQQTINEMWTSRPSHILVTPLTSANKSVRQPRAGLQRRAGEVL